MKLKPECVRAVLLGLEEHLTLKPISISDFSKMMKSFEIIDVYYTCLKLEEGGFLTLSKKYTGDMGIEFDIESMTYQGHEFLESVRNEDTWHKILDIFKGTGSFTLDNAMDIAKEITKSVIKQKLGLNS